MFIDFRISEIGENLIDSSYGDYSPYKFLKITPPPNRFVTLVGLVSQSDTEITHPIEGRHFIFLFH